MMKYAEDDQNFKNTINEFLQKRLITHTLEEVEEVGIGLRGQLCERVFADCMGEGDLKEIMTQIVETDGGMDWDEFARVAEIRACDAIEKEVEHQILIIKAERND